MLSSSIRSPPYQMIKFLNGMRQIQATRQLPVTRSNALTGAAFGPSSPASLHLVSSVAGNFGPWGEPDHRIAEVDSWL